MLEELSAFYKQAKIYSCEFGCDHLDSCKKAARSVIAREKTTWEKIRARANLDKREQEALAKHGQFAEATATYVGSEYESNRSNCRLLFLSLDPGSDDVPAEIDELPSEFPGLRCMQDDPVRRTPETMQNRVPDELKKDVESESPRFPRWVHWYGTHLLAARILREAANAPASELCARVCTGLDSRIDQQSKSRGLAEVTRYFAHANVVKCSIGKLGNAQAPGNMYKNCQSYLKRELAILAPDIVVTQGRDAAQAIEDAFVCRAFDPFNHRLRYLRFSEKAPQDALWIQTLHPRNGVFRTEGGLNWKDFTGAAREFMTGKRKSAAG